MLSPGAVVGAFGAPVATETVVEIRIHGNNSVPDEEVLELAGIAVGDFVDSAELDAVARRLATSGRFETVEVHKRYRSLTATDKIALMIVVRERPRRLDRLMFTPILRYDEGYGISYGLGFGLVDIPGQGGRVSVPMTWGADRRTALGAALLRRRPKGLLPAARQELLDPSKAWWGGRRGRLADRPRYSISVSLGVVPRWYSRVVEVPVRIEVAAGFVAPGASEPPRLQPSWPPGGFGPAHG